MDDLLRIMSALQSSDCRKDALAVATVFNTRGSAFRRPGARMLVKRSGATDGCISAGCLEKDVVAHCEQLKKDPLILTYDGSNRDDLIFGLHLGCDGLIQIFVEPIGSDSLYLGRRDADFPLADLAAVTVIEASDKRIPKGLAFLGNGSLVRWNKQLPGRLIDRLDLECELAYTQRRFCYKEIDVSGYQLKIFSEYVKAIPSILLIGGGAEVAPLAKILQVLGWNYTLVDDRKGRIEASVWNQLSLAAIEPNQLPQWLQRSQFSAAVLMTHDYNRDKTLLPTLLSCELTYLGIVGPRKRTDKLLAEMVLEGLSIPEAGVQCLHGPVGLDIGAERPEEIALSIAAEMQAVFSKGGGGFLRDNRGPIHGQDQANQSDRLEFESGLIAACNL